ncbi:MAG: hypothetical protein MUC36_22960 [Planctomycetes bacterium]|jgi:hypothetical protein|nr:hypothetical protein [Planctomycetota bacterium]
MSQVLITSLRRQWNEWAERPANRKFLQEDQEAQLRAALGDRTKTTQLQVAAWMLGTWWLGHGLVRVLEGDGDGFDEARLGQSLRRCGLLLRARAQNPAPARRGGGGQRLPFSRAHGTWTALLGLALDDPGAEPLYDLLRNEPESAFTEAEHLPLFVRELLTVRAGERPTVTPRLGPYQEVFAHWQGDARLLAQRLVDLCDLHLDGVGTGGPFDDQPCKIYPVEILAFRNVREWLGLPMPKVDHPIMHSNLVTMQAGKGWPQHELVQRLEQELRRR